MDVILATCRRRPELTSSDALLRDALTAEGVTVRAMPWDEIPPGPSGPAICLRSTWDYHVRVEEFRAWLSGFGPRTTRLWNPPATVLRNLDKAYLRELSEGGIRVPPTRWLEPGVRPDVSALLSTTGFSPLVLKPRVSATAHGTHLVTRDTRLSEAEWTELTAHGSLAQAFVPEVLSAGEISLVFIDGDFSHAARKTPRAGDFRVQTDFGGTAEAFIPPAELVSFGEAVLARGSSPWVYARVDVVAAAAGPMLMELELVEPHLFLELAPESAVRLARALIARGSGARRSGA